jgi:hypothetical protein
MTHPTESPAVIADRLAVRYSWTAEERQQHLERLYDITRTTALLTVYQHAFLPSVRTPARLDAFVATRDGRFVDAQHMLDNLDEH